MKPSFLQSYLSAFHDIDGWFSYDAALLFMAYNQLLAAHGIAGDVLEIGVHHGLSTIAIATLRGPEGKLYAVDLFDNLQNLNVSRSGEGNRTLFERNMKRFHGGLDFVRTIARLSSDLTPGDLGASFSFCHVDGGHSRAETLHDLNLCHEILMPGGLVALDDYFNPGFPGVCEGAVEFMLGHPEALRPLAIGYNKVLFQKTPAPAELNAEFSRRYPLPDVSTVSMWDTPTLLLQTPLRTLLDLNASTPQRFVSLGAVGPRVRFAPAAASLRAKSGQALTLAVRITNSSKELLPAGEQVCGLSYHLLDQKGASLRHDNERTWLLTPLNPGEECSLDLRITSPKAPGKYRLEIDLVWEGVMWFKDVGNPTAMVDLVVE
jgi:hypothetical protein